MKCKPAVNTELTKLLFHKTFSQTRNVFYHFRILFFSPSYCIAIYAKSNKLICSTRKGIAKEALTECKDTTIAWKKRSSVQEAIESCFCSIEKIAIWDGDVMTWPVWGLISHQERIVALSSVLGDVRRKKRQCPGDNNA